MKFLVTTRRISVSANTSLRIAHFSTNANYSSRRYEEEVRNVRVSVWWDVESCTLPVGGTNPYRIGHSITNALRANGIKGPLQITAFGNVFKLPKWTQEALSSTGITLTHLPGGKESVSRYMIIELMYWVLQHPPPAHIFLITGDHDMANILHRLRMSNYNILLAGPEDASAALCSAASIMWQWNMLVKGDNFVGRHFNQPPDGSNGSWYGTYRVPLESPFPAVEQPLPARESEPAESEIENTVQDIPIEVTERILQILTTYPKGVPISTLRQELSSTMIVDKKFYGYRKFSSLLSAMPQILKLHHREDGQHLVCPVSSKAHVSADSPTKASENSVALNTNHTNPPTQIEQRDDNSSVKSADDLPTPVSSLVTDEKSKPIEPDHQSSPICNEQPSLKEGCQGPPTTDKDIEAGSGCDSEPTKEQDRASNDGIFQRTWSKWFGNANGADMERVGNHSVLHGPSSDHTRISDAAPSNNSDKVETSDSRVGEILKFCSRVFYGPEANSFDSESAAAGSCSSSVSNQVAQQSLRNDVFSKDGFWTDVKSFMCTTKGANVVSKSISRLQMARAMKSEGPSVIRSLGDDDLLHLVNLLIDDKKWINECLSKTPPFEVIGTSAKFLENSSDLNATSSMLLDEPQQTDLQKQRECDRESPNQVRSRIIESSEERKTRILADVQKLLDAIVKSHPGGYNLSGFRKLFFERYCYSLQLNHLEFDKLTSLISSMSGVKLKGGVIFPSENSDSIPGSSDADLLHDKNTIRQIKSDNELSVPSTHSDSSDSQFDEQLGPVRSLTKNAPSKLSGKQELKTYKERLLQYEPCAEDDIYTDSDGETRTKEGQARGVPKVHSEVSTLIDILSNWEVRKDGAGKSNLSETAPKDNFQFPIKTHPPAEVSKKTSRSTEHKWKPPRTFNFVSDDHKKEVELRNTTEPRQQC